MSDKHGNLSKAKNKKNDEFYTRIEDIDDELKHYCDFIRGKKIYMNCDDPDESAFWEYFADRYEELELNGICATYLTNSTDDAYATFYDGNRTTQKKINGNGSFDNPDCLALISRCDVVITNPPFSLFRRFFSILIDSGKDFAIIGNSNSICCKEIFPTIRNGKVRTGVTKPKVFYVPSDADDDADNIAIDANGRKIAKFGNICWYTTFPIDAQKKTINCNGKTNRDSASIPEYGKYDNYDAIDISRVKDIPLDYDGLMGVPLSLLDFNWYNDFDIVWQASGNTKANCRNDILYGIGYVPSKEDRGGAAILDGKRKYSRLLIKHKDNYEHSEQIESISHSAEEYLNRRFSEQREIDGNEGGKLRSFSGDTVEGLVDLIWNEASQAFDDGREAEIFVGRDKPIEVDDGNGGKISESVDRHCFIDNTMVLAVECKTYLDKCYMQRADSDFQIMRSNGNLDFGTVIIALEDSIAYGSYRFFMNRGNISNVFYLANGKRCSDADKRIYNNPDRIDVNSIAKLVEYICSLFER